MGVWGDGGVMGVWGDGVTGCGLGLGGVGFGFGFGSDLGWRKDLALGFRDGTRDGRVDKARCLHGARG